MDLKLFTVALCIIANMGLMASERINRHNLLESLVVRDSGNCDAKCSKNAHCEKGFCICDDGFKGKPYGALCSKCKEDWKAKDDSCYYFSTDYETWKTAMVKCKSFNASLTEVNSAEEEGYLQENIISGDNWIAVTKFRNEAEETKCATLSKSKVSQMRNDETCNKRLQYICEIKF